MAELPPNYPHGCTDEQILSAISSLSQDVFQSPNINTVLHLTPLISLGQNELQHRLVEKMRTATEKNLDVIQALQKETITLKEITDQAATSSNQLSQRSIRLTRINTGLAFLMLILTIAMLLMVWRQTTIADRQNVLFEKTVLAHPQLDVKFLGGEKMEDHALTYELRIENLGDTFADGAFLHLWLPSGLDMSILWGGGLSFPPENDGNTTHREFHILEKVLVGRNTRVAGIAFKFKKPAESYDVKYLVAAPGAKDVSGIFTMRDKDFIPPEKPQVVA